MDFSEFGSLLKKSGLNKKEFSERTKLAYSTVANWNSKSNVPDWVESWLENYIEKTKYEKIKAIIKDEIV